MTLDELLTRAGTVEAPKAELVDGFADTVAAAARADIARRAVLVRRRRFARLGTAAIGVGAAAAIVGAVALQPSDHAPSQQVKPPVQTPVSPNFRTVAQVVNAAAAATPDLDPTAAPYWKTVTESHSFGSWMLPDGTYCNQPNHQIHTEWNGNAGPGIFMNTGDQVGPDNGKPIAMAATSGAVIDGRMLTWRQINAGHWTEAQIATMVVDGGGTKGDGRPPEAYYVFKNTAETLMSQPASPTIRKALWRNLAAQPGVRLDGRAKDALGRSGWQLSYQGPTIGGHKYGDELAIVDPSTGQLLQSSVSFPADASPSVDTLISAGPAHSAPAPQPEWSPPPVPVGTPAPPIKQQTRQQMFEQARRQAAEPLPYPTCPANIASLR